MNRIYTGARINGSPTVMVWDINDAEGEPVDGHMLKPDKSQRVYNHSPDGFEWGYGGSGPAQLALAILLNEKVPEVEAVKLHQAFKTAFIAGFEHEEWSLWSKTIEAWVENERKGKA